MPDDDELELELCETLPVVEAENTPPANHVVDDEDDDELSDDFVEEEEPATWFVLTSLLFTQFGMALCEQNESFAFSAIIYVSVGLFVVAVALYKERLNERYKKGPMLCILLPEIMVNIILGVTFLFNIDWGFLVLLMCMILLKCTVLVMTLQTLYLQHNNAKANQQFESEQDASNGLLVCQVV